MSNARHKDDDPETTLASIAVEYGLCRPYYRLEQEIGETVLKNLSNGDMPVFVGNVFGLDSVNHFSCRGDFAASR